MALANATYDPADDFDIGGVKGGDAEEIEARILELMAASDTPASIADFYLAGVEEGPEFEACFVFATGALPGIFLRTVVRVAAAVSADPDELRSKLLARMDAIADAEAIAGVAKIEVAGGGIGEKAMAVAIMIAV